MHPVFRMLVCALVVFVAADSIARDRGAAGRCWGEVTATTTSFGGSGGGGDLVVSAPEGCAWEVKTRKLWVALPLGRTGAGPGRLPFVVAPNFWKERAVNLRLRVVGGTSRSVRLQQLARTETRASILTPSRCEYRVVVAPQYAGIGELPVYGATGWISVETLGICPWKLRPTVPWMRITNTPPTGGTGIAYYTVDPNPGAKREGYFVWDGVLPVAPANVRIAQAGDCKYIVTPTSRKASPEGETLVVSVETHPTCTWSVGNLPTWISVIATTQSQVTLAIKPNAGTARAESVLVAGTSVKISQGAGECPITAVPASASVPATGGSVPVDVTVPSGCSWTASADAWLSLTPASGTVSGRTSIGFPAYTGTTARLGNATFRSKNGSVGVTIQQQVPQCGTPSVAPSLRPFPATDPAAGLTQCVIVTAPTGCAWTLDEGLTWLTATPTRGSGTTEVCFRANPNATPLPNAGTVTVAGTLMQVEQAAGCRLSVNPSAVPFTAGGGTSCVDVVSDRPSCLWTAIEDVAWLRITSGSSGSGTGRVCVAAQENGGAGRSASVTIGNATLFVLQSDCTYTLTPESLRFPEGASSMPLTITTEAGCPWSVSGLPSWLRTSSASGSGPRTILLSATANRVLRDRTALLTVAARSVPVTQRLAGSLILVVLPAD